MTRQFRWIGVFLATMLAVAMPAMGETNGAADEQNRHPLIRVSTGEIACAHFADGQDWTTEFVFFNMWSQTKSGFLFFHNSDGDLQQVSFKNGMREAIYRLTIPPGGSHRLETLGGSGPLTEGSVKFLPDDGLEGYIAGTAIFRRELPGIPTYEASVTCEARSYGAFGSAFLPFDHRNGYSSGVAIANMHPTDEMVLAARFTNEAGENIAIGGGDHFVIKLDGNRHTAFSLTEEFPQTMGKVGVLRVWLRIPRDHRGFQMLGFRFSPDGPFSTIEPVIPEGRRPVQ